MTETGVVKVPVKTMVPPVISNAAAGQIKMPGTPYASMYACVSFVEVNLETPDRMKRSDIKKRAGARKKFLGGFILAVVAGESWMTKDASTQQVIYVSCPAKQPFHDFANIEPWQGAVVDQGEDLVSSCMCRN